MVALIAVIVIFHTLSTIFPLCSDDFSYSYVCGGEERVEGVVEIIRSQCHHYCVWGGRFFVHCIAQFFLMFDKAVFNIANTLCYILRKLLTNDIVDRHAIMVCYVYITTQNADISVP